MDTKLVTRKIDRASDAPWVVNEYNVQGNDKITPVVLIPGRNPCSFYITLPEGFYCVMTAYDSYVGIWKAGFHVAKPWEKCSHMVTRQYVVYDTPVKECPTLDNVMVEVDVSLVFRINEFEDDVKNFVYKLGPERLESMLKAYQEESVRSMARQKKYSSIYDLMDTEELVLPAQFAKGAEAEAGTDQALALEVQPEAVTMPGQGTEMTPMKKTEYHAHDLNKDGKVDVDEQLEITKRDMNKKLSPYGVNVYSITITQVLLPYAFRAQMEEATTFESKNIRAAAEQKYELLVIGDTEKQNQANQALEEKLEEAVSKNQQRCANEKKITSLFEAGTSAIVADVKEKMLADEREVNTVSALKVATLKKEKEIELAGIKAGAEAEVVKIRTEMEAFVLEKQAEAAKAAAEYNSKTLKAQATAEKVASTKLKARRDYEARMSNLRVLRNLATNPNAAISGSNTDSVVAQMLAAKNSSVSLGLNVE